MAEIRKKSMHLTRFLEHLLLKSSDGLFTIITPSNPAERGAQLSLRLRPGILDGVQERLEACGVVVDERKPDVIRVAPAPLYNTYLEVLKFCRLFVEACQRARSVQRQGRRDE